MALLLGANVDLKSLNLDDFTIPIDSSKIVLVNEAKCSERIYVGTITFSM